MTLQRENGPDGCYPGPYAFTLNGYTANVTCTPTGNYFGTGRGRFALIATGNDFEAQQLVGNGPGATSSRSSATCSSTAGRSTTAPPTSPCRHRPPACSPTCSPRTMHPRRPPGPGTTTRRWCRPCLPPRRSPPTATTRRSPPPWPSRAPGLPGRRRARRNPGGSWRATSTVPRPTTTPSCRRCRPTCVRACRRRPSARATSTSRAATRRRSPWAPASTSSPRASTTSRTP